jgi:hypothetical protein
MRSYSDNTETSVRNAPQAPGPGETLTATVPLADMPGIQKSIWWSSGLDIDGQGASACPNNDDLVEYAD